MCPDCGVYYEEWDVKKGGHIHAYYPKANYCMGCKSKQDKYDAIRENESGKTSAMNGIQMDLEKNPAAGNLVSPMTNKPIQHRPGKFG